MAALLEIQALEAVADGGWLLRDISLSIEEGRTVALVGGGGAGKTALLDLILGLAVPRGGKQLLDGRDIGGLSPLARQRLGLRCAFQRPPVFPGLAVREHLALATPSVRLEPRAFERLAEHLPELAGHLDQPVETLDHALLRLVDLGRALLGLPRLLLIDDLFPAIGIERARELVAALSREGYTMLIADRYAERALEHADYGYVLVEGRIRAKGQPADLVRDWRLLASCAGDPGAYDDR